MSEPLKKLEFNDLLKISKQTHRVEIKEIGYITITTPTVEDQQFAYTGSNNGEDVMQYQTLLLTRIIVDPVLSETQIKQLPDIFPAIVLAKVNQLNEELREKADFFEK